MREQTRNHWRPHQSNPKEGDIRLIQGILAEVIRGQFNNYEPCNRFFLSSVEYPLPRCKRQRISELEVEMLIAKSLVQLSIVALSAAIVTSPANAADPMFETASLEFGTTSKARMLRVGVQSPWEKQWFASNGTHLSGYWDLSLAQWRATAYRNIPGETQNITNLGLTPVFRFQANDKRGWYAEGGIGLNLLSTRYDNDGSELSTHFQFGDHIGAGYVFANRWDVGMKIQHFSNGGIKKPNGGVNFLILKAARAF